MFAPPPVQLSRAQIEIAQLEAKARAEEKAAANTSDNGSSTGPSRTRSPTASPQTELHSRKRKNGLFPRSGKLKVSHPIAQSPSVFSADREEAKEETVKKESPLSPVPFGEQPRRAPVPPKRPARPPSELFIPPLPGAFPFEPPFTAGLPQPHSALPTVQTVSSGRGNSSTDPFSWEELATRNTSVTDVVLSAALARVSVQDGITSVPPRLPRSSTAPALIGQDGDQAVATERAMMMDGGEQPPARKAMRWLTEVQGGRVDKLDMGKRGSAVASTKVAVLDKERSRFEPTRRAVEGDLKSRSRTPPQLQVVASQRRPEGETMSMLLDSGFFSPTDGASKSGLLSLNTHVKLSPPLSLLNKELPDTPDSIMATPTEMYHSAPRHPKPVEKIHRLRVARRSPLSQISGNSKNARKRSLTAGVSPSRLSAIPETSSFVENSPPPSGVTTPTATQIHLSGGSVVTVMPPEMNPWLRHIYVQGPIKLPKPTIMPRKNSVASLEPFQEVIDQVYQDALVIPRRRSDDAVVDDICDWFDEFGFEETGFEGDKVFMIDIQADKIERVDETDSAGIERFSTPPNKPAVTPVEKAVAKEVLEMSNPASASMALVPPLDNEDTLRARGKARLLQQSSISRRPNGGRRESLTLPRADALTPLPEQSMLGSVLETQATALVKGRDRVVDPLVDQRGFDWDNGVEEMTTSPTWTSPAVMPQQHALDGNSLSRQTRNPVTKVRHIMATASAIQ